MTATVDEPDQLVIVTDPGPDPDDLKACLAAAVAHQAREIKLRAVVCNGGGPAQVRKRAALARCVLDHIGAFDVPVGVGSPGEEYTAETHEYALDGFDDVDPARLLDGAELLRSTFELAPPASLTVLLISSMRDFADLAKEHADLVTAKVRAVSVMGGLEPDASSRWGWKPDASVNNNFDPAAAELVYDFCFAHGVPMTVVSRGAVPMIPMQCIRNFTAGNCDCPVLHYLSAAQQAGLVGLWKRLCCGQLPPRCTKRWYLETFGGEGAKEADPDSLDGQTDITSYLSGRIKPYDVVALMSVLPRTRERVARCGRACVVQGVAHVLLLDAESVVDAADVRELLTATYAHVVSRTRPPPPTPAESNVPLIRSSQSGELVSLLGGQRLSACSASSGIGSPAGVGTPLCRRAPRLQRANSAFRVGEAGSCAALGRDAMRPRPAGRSSRMVARRGSCPGGEPISVVLLSPFLHAPTDASSASAMYARAGASMSVLPAAAAAAAKAIDGRA